MTLLCSRRLPCGSLMESFLFMFGVYVMTLKWLCVVWKLSTLVRQVHVWECLWAVFTVCFWLTVPPLSNFLRLSFEMMIILVCVLFPKHSNSERYFFWHVHTVKTHLRHLLLPKKYLEHVLWKITKWKLLKFRFILSCSCIQQVKDNSVT